MTPLASDLLYLDIAHRVAESSYCKRRQVGAIIVTSHGIMIPGYNGTVSGSENVCELDNGETDPRVLHAESNVFSKVLRAGISTEGATMYITLSPCLDCAKMIVQSGVTRVVYSEGYRCNKGLTMLTDSGIIVEQIAGGVTVWRHGVASST